MARTKAAYLYVLSGGAVLKSHPQDKGSHFRVYQCSEDGKWYWELKLAYSPYGAAARSARGYRTRQQAERSIGPAFRAMQQVVQR